MSRRNLGLLVGIGWFTLWFAGGGLSVVAGEPAEKLVQQALQTEIDGTIADRQALLEKALRHDSQYAPARWHSGSIKRNGEWEQYVRQEPANGLSKALLGYWKIRGSHDDSYQGHLDLANWCRKHNLPRQERAHLTAALDRSGNPNHAGLRTRLGFQFIDGRWVTRADLEIADRRSKELQRAFDYWEPRLRRIAKGLNSKRTKGRENSLAKLKAIDDPAALPVMEFVFANQDLHTSLFLLDVYDSIKSYQAARTLSRQAIVSPFKAVREAAAQKLKSRPPEQYAPQLLAGLYAPIESKMSLYVDPIGVKTIQEFVRETGDVRKRLVVTSETQIRRLTTVEFLDGISADSTQLDLNIGPNGLHQSMVTRAFAETAIDARLKAYALRRELESRNEEGKELNERIVAALAGATGVELPADPHKWWQWWLDYNDLYQESQKSDQVVHLHQGNVISVPYYIYKKPSSCLAAGTLVWTDRGPVPVESVQVGDLALAKHPDSGELAYKPVFQTTIRPTPKIQKVKLGGESFQATAGHTFWIAGQGWMKIRDTEAGMRFHGAAAPTELLNLENIDDGDPRIVYNLIVADFHSYFVGKSMILSHDPTFAQPTDLLVPGLAAK